MLGYDHTVNRLWREILLVNIGRLRHGLPVHFTLATSIAATFDYQTNAAILGLFSDLGLSVSVPAAENPSWTIMPILDLRGRYGSPRISRSIPMQMTGAPELLTQKAPLHHLPVAEDGRDERPLAFA